MKLISAILSGDIKTINEAWESNPEEFFKPLILSINTILGYDDDTTSFSGKLPIMRLTDPLKNNTHKVRTHLHDTVSIQPIELIAVINSEITSKLKDCGIFSKLLAHNFYFEMREWEDYVFRCSPEIFSQFLSQLKAFDYIAPCYRLPEANSEEPAPLTLPFTEEDIRQKMIPALRDSLKKQQYWNDIHFRKIFLDNPDNTTLTILDEYLSQLSFDDDFAKINKFNELLEQRCLTTKGHYARKLKKIHARLKTRIQAYENKAKDTAAKKILHFVTEDIENFFFTFGLTEAPTTLDLFSRVQMKQANDPIVIKKISELTSYKKIKLFNNLINTEKHNSYIHFITLLINQCAINQLDTIRDSVEHFKRYHPKSSVPGAKRLKNTIYYIDTLLKKIADIPETKRMKFALLHAALSTNTSSNLFRQPNPPKTTEKAPALTVERFKREVGKNLRKSI